MINRIFSSDSVVLFWRMSSNSGLMILKEQRREWSCTSSQRPLMPDKRSFRVNLFFSYMISRFLGFQHSNVRHSWGLSAYIVQDFVFFSKKIQDQAPFLPFILMMSDRAWTIPPLTLS